MRSVLQTVRRYYLVRTIGRGVLVGALAVGPVAMMAAGGSGQVQISWQFGER